MRTELGPNRCAVVQDGAEGVTQELLLGTIAGFAALVINMALWSADSLVGSPAAAVALTGSLLVRRRWPTGSVALGVSAATAIQRLAGLFRTPTR